MINEVLYMEVRLIREFCKKYHVSMGTANEIFKKNDIWSYIEDCYKALHTCGDEYILNDIEVMIQAKKSALPVEAVEALS